MKPFEYYGTNTVKYPNKSIWLLNRTKVINAYRMTETERTDALREARSDADEWFREEVKPYNNRANELISEFWRDVREDLGYDDFLNEQGCQSLEKQAWSDSHSGGFSDTYNAASNLCDFAREIVKHVKSGK